VPEKPVVPPDTMEAEGEDGAMSADSGTGSPSDVTGSVAVDPIVDGDDAGQVQ
jgi:hypothetical protein